VTSSLSVQLVTKQTELGVGSIAAREPVEAVIHDRRGRRLQASDIAVINWGDRMITNPTTLVHTYQAPLEGVIVQVVRGQVVTGQAES
jgi:hypothetical protein